MSAGKKTIEEKQTISFKGTVMQIENALMNDRLRV